MDTWPRRRMNWPSCGATRHATRETQACGLFHAFQRPHFVIEERRKKVVLLASSHTFQQHNCFLTVLLVLIDFLLMLPPMLCLMLFLQKKQTLRFSTSRYPHAHLEPSFHFFPQESKGQFSSEHDNVRLCFCFQNTPSFRTSLTN